MNLSTLIAAAQAHAATHRLLHAAAEALDIDVDCLWDDSADALFVYIYTGNPGTPEAADAIRALGAEPAFASGYRTNARLGSVVLFAGRF